MLHGLVPAAAIDHSRLLRHKVGEGRSHGAARRPPEGDDVAEGEVLVVGGLQQQLRQSKKGSPN